MDFVELFDALENTFVSFSDLAAVAVEECHELMTNLRKLPNLTFAVIDERMQPFTGDDIYVRRTVAAMLQKAQATLSDLLPGTILETVYGYRHMDIQIEAYRDVAASVAAEHPWATEQEVKAKSHIFIAAPEVSGHPTGGAVDVRLVDKDRGCLDMGTQAHQFVKESYVHFPFISKTAFHHRQLLRHCMLIAGFAPFDGEWWHFSYGDREWAKYYGKPKAIYDQIRFQVPKEDVRSGLQA